MADTLRTEAELLALLIVGGDRSISAQDLRDCIYSMFREVLGEGNISLLSYLTKSTGAGDEGVNCTGHLHVGSPGAGRELVVGEGDSHVTGMTVLTATSAGSVFTDVTTEAASGSGSTWTPFETGAVVDDAFYVGSDSTFEGLKVTTTSPGTPDGSLTVVREYWNGSAWTSFQMMVTNADYPYQSRADDAATVVGAEQWRFATLTGHALTTVDGVSKYWVRYRITAGSFTATPATEQVKLHTNRWECNADGFTEYFGQGRYEKDLLMQWKLGFDLSGFSPANENIDVSSDLTLVYTNNEFTANAIDGYGSFVVIPQGLDTSKGIRIEMLWKPASDATGDVVLEAGTTQIAVGDLLDGSAAAVTMQATIPVAAGQGDRLQQTSLTVDTQNLVPGEILFGRIARIGSDAADTYPSAIHVINVRLVGTFWHP